MAVQGFDEYVNTHTGAGDAWAYLSSLLADYGLAQLDDQAQQWVIESLSPNEIVQRLKTTQPYKERFKVIDDRKQAGLPAISEAEVVAYEKQATQLFRSAGLPKGFYDSPDDFYKLQMSDVSLSELDARVNKGYVAAMAMPQDVRDEAKSLYGLSEGDLAAFFLDPQRTEAVITEQFGASQRAAEAQRTGFGQLDKTQAEDLQKLSGTDATQGFTQLANEKQLFNALPGENVDNVSVDQQLAAQFAGNADAQNAIKKIASQRAALFQGGGSYVQNKEGFAGVGTAR